MIRSVTRFAILGASTLWLFSGTAGASAPTCSTYNGQGYCDYSGRVYAAYINSSNQVILYFDTVMDPTSPTSVGIGGVTIYNAAIYNLADNMDFGKALYATLLAAQARGASIKVQLWGTYGGYMKMDRIWVYE